MLTIDEIKIEGEEDGFYLTVYTDEPARAVIGGTSVIVDPNVPHTFRFRIGLPDQFYAETRRTIGQWLAEGEAAARAWEIERGDAPNSRDANLDDLIESGAADLMRDRMRGK